MRQCRGVRFSGRKSARQQMLWYTAQNKCPSLAHCSIRATGEKVPRAVSKSQPGSRRIPRDGAARAGAGTYLYTYDGVILQMDALAFAIFGLDESFPDPGEVVGQNLTDIIHYMHPVGEARERVQRFGQVHGLERRFKTLLGEPRCVTCDMCEVAVENQPTPVVQATVRDISRQKRTEEALREADDRWRAVFETHPAPQLILHPKTGRIVEANAAAAGFYGLSRKALRSTVIHDLIQQADCSEGVPPPGRQWHRAAGDTVREVLVQQGVLPWRSREHLHWHIADLTPLASERAGLIERAARLQRITQAVLDYVFRVRVDNGTAVDTEHGAACFAVTGYTADELRADPYLWYFMVHEEDRHAVLAQAADILAGRAFVPIEHRILRKDGALRWVRNTPVPDFDPSGRLVAYDGLIRDITPERTALDNLRESERRYRTVFETGYQALFVVDHDLRILDCNASACTLHGMTREELLVAPLSRRMPPMAAEQMHAMFGQVARLGHGTCESQRFGANNQLLDVEVTVTRHFVEGAPNYLVSLHDITDRKRAEAELRHIKQTLDLTLDAILMFDPDSLCFTYANRGAAEMTGLERDSLLGRTPLDLSPAINRQELNAILDPLRHRHIPARRIEASVLHADGHLVPVEVFLQWIDPGDDAPRFVALLRDLTAQRAAAAALRQSEARLAKAQQVARLGNWSYTMGAATTELSAEARSIFGLHDDAAPGPPESLFRDAVIAEDWPDTEQALGALFDHALPFALEVRVQPAQGPRRHLQCTGMALRDEDGTLSEVYGTVQDITERKLAEEERLRLEAQMRQAQKLESLGVLAGGIAHDFNNILTAILGNAGLLLENLPEEGPHRRRLHDIETAAKRAADLARQMLAYSGRGNFIIRLIDLNDLVRDTIRILEASISKKIALQFEPATPLPAVQADASQLAQVVLNLLTNAAEAIGDETGAITVRTGVVEQAEAEGEAARSADGGRVPPGRFVLLEVIDTGCGIPEEVRARLFDPFFTTKFAGRGLGLAAVLGIVRAHHGAVVVESAPGEGARFRVLLPASAGVAAPAAVEDAAAADYRGNGLVLLVDDEPAIRAVGTRMLETMGFTVITAEDGVEAVAQFQAHQAEIVCVVLDLTMPRMDGAETLQELTRLHPGVRVVLCSGYSHEEVAARFADQGVAGVLHKPFQMHQLATVIRAALAPRA